MKPISFKKAAESILKRANEPKSAKEITEIALEEGLISTQGATPEATMAAQLYVDINKNKKSVFQKVGRGLFALKKASENQKSPIVILEDQNRLIKERLRKTLHEMDPFQFELLIGDLLINIGFENVEVTKRSGDKGVDVIANLTVGGVTNVKTVVQVKRYGVKNKISGSVIRELRGSAEVDQRGLVITTSSFQPDAIRESSAPNKMPVSLIDGDKLIELLVRYEVGIKKTNVTLLDIDVDYFENESDSIETLSKKSSKNKALWPLPGGINRYVETLNEFLEVLNEKSFKRAHFQDWIINKYENVNSQRTANGYVNVLKSIGVTYIKDGKIAISSEGSEYLKTKDSDYLYSIISANVLAFEDIHQLIENSETPTDEQTVLDFVNENFDVNWTSFAQVNYRLLWLANLNKIEKTTAGYTSLSIHP